MNETKVICPQCGAEIAIPNHEHLTAGIAIGKDSGLGTITLPLAAKGGKPTRAEQRLEALRKAGVDTSGLHALKGVAGEGLLIRMDADGPHLLNDNDPLFSDPECVRILGEGHIPERRLFRRWVMAQMFRMLDNEQGVTAYIQNMGAKYMWRMTTEEMRVQARLQRNDPENYAMRHRFFNQRLILSMLTDLRKQWIKYISELPVKHCKGEPYKCIATYGDVFLKDIDKTVFAPIDETITAVEKFGDDNYELYEILHHRIFRIFPSMKTSRDWEDAYKGAGAYFTLRNLVMFHGVTLQEGNTVEDNLKVIDDKAARNNYHGWTLLGYLKDVLINNGIDVHAQRIAWAQEFKQKAQTSCTA